MYVKYKGDESKYFTKDKIYEADWWLHELTCQDDTLSTHIIMEHDKDRCWFLKNFDECDSNGLNLTEGIIISGHNYSISLDDKLELVGGSGMLTKQLADLYFEQEKDGLIYNTKNRFSEELYDNVSKEVLDMLLNSYLKIVYIDRDGYITTNFQ